MKYKFIILILFLILCLFLNISFHEASHYFIAESLGLGPSVHITGYSDYKQAGFLSPNLAFAAVEYSSGNPTQDFLVAIAGPLANFSLAGLGLLLFRKKKSIALTMFIIISFLSGALNLMPFWHSDGLQVFDFITKSIS